MSYITINEARKAARDEVNRSFRANSKAILKSLSESVYSHERFDIFLSHSLKDAELILGVKLILEKQGLKVYVDWQDDPQATRDNVTSETAELLRVRMKQSKSLIYIATSNSSDSKWMPWELGYFDGYSNGSVGILPLLEYSSSSFKGQEYLGLYPVIEKSKYSNMYKGDILVRKNNLYLTIKEFSQGNLYWKRYAA